MIRADPRRSGYSLLCSGTRSVSRLPFLAPRCYFYFCVAGGLWRGGGVGGLWGYEALLQMKRVRCRAALGSLSDTILPIQFHTSRLFQNLHPASRFPLQLNMRRDAIKTNEPATPKMRSRVTSQVSSRNKLQRFMRWSNKRHQLLIVFLPFRTSDYHGNPLDGQQSLPPDRDNCTE